MQLPGMPPDEAGGDARSRRARRRRTDLARVQGRDLRRLSRRQQRGHRGGRRRPRLAPVAASPTTRPFPSCSPTSVTSGRGGASRSSRGATCARSTRSCDASEMLALLVDWGYRPEDIPVRLFGAWTTLPGRTGDARRRRPGRRSCRSSPDGCRTAASMPPPSHPIHVAVDRARRDPPRDPGHRRRDRAGDRGRARAVVQLQADVAGDRGRGAGARARGPRRMARRMSRAGAAPGRDRSRRPDGRTRPAAGRRRRASPAPRGSPAASRRGRSSGWPTSSASCGTASIARARRAGPAQPAPGRPAGLVAEGPRRARIRAAAPSARALERLVRAAFRHYARYYLESPGRRR